MAEKNADREDFLGANHLRVDNCRNWSVQHSVEGNGLCTSVYYKPTDSHSYFLYSSSHPSHVKNSIPFFSFSDFVVYVVKTLIFPKNQRQLASFLINVAILFLSFKRATTVPNKLIESQHYKRLRRKTLTAFHSLSHFTLTTTRLNLSFLKTLNYSKTIQRLALFFRNPTYFIQTRQKHRQLFDQKFNSNQ